MSLVAYPQVVSEQTGPLRQLQARLEGVREGLAAVRVNLTGSVNSLLGGAPEEIAKERSRPSTLTDGMVHRLTDVVEDIQAEISRLDVLVQRLGGLL